MIIEKNPLCTNAYSPRAAGERGKLWMQQQRQAKPIHETSANHDLLLRKGTRRKRYLQDTHLRDYEL